MRSPARPDLEPCVWAYMRWYRASAVDRGQASALELCREDRLPARSSHLRWSADSKRFAVGGANQVWVGDIGPDSLRASAAFSGELVILAVTATRVVAQEYKGARPFALHVLDVATLSSIAKARVR